jgi:hypothetical protein
MHLYLKYQSSSTFGSKDIAQVKVFSFRCDADAEADTDSGVMTIALRTVVPASLWDIFFPGKEKVLSFACTMVR